METDYVISFKSKCLCGSILSPQNYAFLHTIKRFWM